MGWSLVTKVAYGRLSDPAGRNARLTARGKAFRAYVVAYADDFVILSRGYAAEALAWTKAVMTRLGLMLIEIKVSVQCGTARGRKLQGSQAPTFSLRRGRSAMLRCQSNKRRVVSLTTSTSRAATIEPDEQSAVGPTQMQSSRPALLEDIELMPQGQVFGFQPSSRLEAVAQHADKEECDCDLRSQSCSDSVAAVTPADAVFGSDRRAAIIGDSLKIGVCFLVS
jgi:hypothetical protein